MIIAVLYRLDVWLNEPGFFGDEGALISNISEKTFFQLLQGLNNFQSCPIMFLYINRIIYCFFGLNENALRFIPFLCGIAVFFIIPILCKKIFNSKYTAFLFISLLAFNDNIVYYSQEFKQYSSDVLITAIYLTLFFILKDKIIDKKTAISAGCILGLSGFFSICSEFLIIAVIFYFLYKFIRNKTIIVNILIPYAVLSFIILLITIIPSLNNGILNSWVDEEFAFQSLEHFKNTVIYLSGFYSNNILLISLFFAGLTAIFIKDKLLFFILTCPVLLNMISGLLNLYPFVANRAILYLSIPVIIICIYPIDFFLKYLIKKELIKNFLIIFLSIFVFANMYNNRAVYEKGSSYYFIRCSAREYINALKTRDVLKDDIIFVDTQGHGVFDVYDKNKKYINENRILYMVFNKPIDVYDSKGEINSLNELPKNSKIYFYNSNFYTDAVNVNAVNLWIKENCKILYSKKDILGTLIYAEKVH